MSYSKLRWRIKDLEDKLEKAEESAKHWHEAYDDRKYETWGYQSKISEYEGMFTEFGEKVNALSEDNKHLHEENECLKHDLNMAEQQYESANNEILRLLREVNELKLKLESTKKGGCRFEQRREH